MNFLVLCLPLPFDFEVEDEGVAGEATEVEAEGLPRAFFEE